MDSAVNSAVGTSLGLEQAQTAQQAQMQVLKEALDSQKDQVSALMESAGAEPELADEGHLGTQINAYA
ncbi:putative motility protein [Billgrantia gudaonensis]|uniref:Putative motility protein n=1 Tax=Billgrantia gudaonensis TaxID=376427 RepID=A0A1G9DDJ7_9GAMM|nr:putative motility protein [Halomonas gudaonensis]SDK61889.1 Putative motility protein [Halomonas gudaonensis]